MANVKISELPVATSLSNGDSFPVVQGGVTKQAARSVLFASPTFTGTTTADLLTATGDVTFDGGAFVFNDSGADKDARFEGDTDANLLFLDASTNRVGIGTATPAAKLDVNGSAAITGNVTLTGDVVLANDQYLYWGVGDGSAYVRGNSSSDYVSFGTVGVERMRLDSSGNVGIGTTSPAAKLDVNGPASVTSFTGSTRLGVTVKGSTAATDYSGIDFSGNNQIIPTARIAVLSESGGSSLVFGTSNNYATGITNSALTIDFLGNLISKVNGAAPSLSTNSTMSFELTSNTSLKIVVRGTDGVTRSVSLTLA